MVDLQACTWLMENADAPIRYRVAREFLNNANADTEKELLENPQVQLWLKNLKPETPPQHWRMIHGSFDFNFENALLKVIQLGLHAGLEPVKDAVGFYINHVKRFSSYRDDSGGDTGMVVGFLSLAGLKELADAKTAPIAVYIGVWPLETAHDPALDEAGIPAGASVFGLFDQSYTKYAVPESIDGLSQVKTLAELKPDCWCGFKASSGFSYIAAKTADPAGLIAGIKTKKMLEYLLERLDSVYKFVTQKNYDIYMGPEERGKLKSIPKNWKNNLYFIDTTRNFCYPCIHEIVSYYKFYDMKDTETDKKINAIIDYISTDEFHTKIVDGYGIVIVGGRYYSMGWDPKYPGWFDVAKYMETDNVPKLLFFAEYISKYPAARKTKWFVELLAYLERYKTSEGTYLFPKEWLKESQGYAVLGHHLSFGENRKKKNWCEIESTFYMLLLKQNLY